MQKYYTRACNFYYGLNSKLKIKKKLSIPLDGRQNISFDHIELISRNSKKKIYFKNIKFLPRRIKKKIYSDIKLIKKKKKIKNLNLTNTPILMGILNLTPDSFSDGGKYLKTNSGYMYAKKIIQEGCKIIDIGGESTRPGASNVNEKKEWERISATLKKIKKLKYYVSIDTRKSWIMEQSIINKANLINDVSGLNFDPNSIKVIKKYNAPFVLNHMKGSPKTMQDNPKYKNVLLDIYDYFEKKINLLRKNGILHNNIILDPGIGFGKNLKHNITLISNVSIFHSLGFPILLGLSRKSFIKNLSGKNDSNKRVGGTVSSCLFSMLQGVQILRVHDANEINQSLKVFKTLIMK